MQVYARDPAPDLAGQVEVGGPGQVRVDAALHAYLGGAGRPRRLGPGTDLLLGERVGVGVAPPLRERAEPAPGVADVREVDVPIDDVGDVVADGVAPQVVRKPAELLERGAGRAEQDQGVRVADARRIVGGAPQRGPHLAVEARRRGGGSHGRRVTTGHSAALRGATGHSAAGYGAGSRADHSVRAGARGADLRAQDVPVAVDRGEVRPAVGTAAGDVDGRLQVDPAAVGEPAVRLLPGAARRGRSRAQQAVRTAQRGHMRA